MRVCVLKLKEKEEARSTGFFLDDFGGDVGDSLNVNPITINSLHLF